MMNRNKINGLGNEQKLSIPNIVSPHIISDELN